MGIRTRHSPLSPTSSLSLFRMLALVMVLIAGLVASAAEAGQRLVSANQHKTKQAGSTACPLLNPPDPIPPVENQDLPLDVLGSFQRLAGNAYHIGNDYNFAQARCLYKSHGKFKIISSDISGVDPADAKDWILHLEDNHELGQIHFEHFEPCLNRWAELGHVISDYSSFPNLLLDECPAGTVVGPREMIVWIKNSSGANLAETVLLQNGQLHTIDSGDTRTLKWRVWDTTVPTPQFRDLPKRLVGFGFMGALTAGDQRLYIVPFMQTLRAHNVNFIRVWATEQWIGVIEPQGVAPFLGTYVYNGESYDLDQDSPSFYDRLRRFVQNAADRGIAVQLSLFDKHGLICPDRRGKYRDSPYRNLNNVPAQQYLANTIPDCTCAPSDGPLVDDPLNDQYECHPLDTFITDSRIDIVHDRFVRRVGEEVGGIGNVIFEVINEAYAPEGNDVGDWGSIVPGTGTTRNQVFQKDIVDRMRLSLPLESDGNKNLVRDAFNGDADLTILNGKASDAVGIYWGAEAAQVKLQPNGTEWGGENPARRHGYATARGFAAYMSGELNFSSGSPWTKLFVRADLTCLSGELQLGTRAQYGNPNSDSVWIVLDCGLDGAEWPWSHLRLFKRISGQISYVASIPIEDANATQDIKLRIAKNPAGALSASVYIDGRLALQDVALGAVSGFNAAYFWGSSCYGDPSCIYAVDEGRVDNFEAARFCDDASRGCVP